MPSLRKHMAPKSFVEDAECLVDIQIGLGGACTYFVSVCLNSFCERIQRRKLFGRATRRKAEKLVEDLEKFSLYGCKRSQCCAGWCKGGFANTLCSKS